MRPETVLTFCATLPACIVAMKACCGAHHMGRVLAAQGHRCEGECIASALERVSRPDPPADGLHLSAISRRRPMSDGYPSMTALLGLLALAGYQNRDKLAELLGGRGQSAPAPTDPGAAPGASGGGLGSLLSDRRGEAPGAFLHSGLGEMLERFQQAGHGAAAQSWVNQGPNQELSAQHWSAPPGVDGTGRED